MRQRPALYLLGLVCLEFRTCMHPDTNMLRHAERDDLASSRPPSSPFLLCSPSPGGCASCSEATPQRTSLTPTAHCRTAMPALMLASSLVLPPSPPLIAARLPILPSLFSPYFSDAEILCLRWFGGRGQREARGKAPRGETNGTSSAGGYPFQLCIARPAPAAS